MGSSRTVSARDADSDIASSALLTNRLRDEQVAVVAEGFQGSPRKNGEQQQLNHELYTQHADVFKKVKVPPLPTNNSAFEGRLPEDNSKVVFTTSYRGSSSSGTFRLPAPGPRGVRISKGIRLPSAGRARSLLRVQKVLKKNDKAKKAKQAEEKKIGEMKAHVNRAEKHKKKEIEDRIFAKEVQSRHHVDTLKSTNDITRVNRHLKLIEKLETAQQRRKEIEDERIGFIRDEMREKERRIEIMIEEQATKKFVKSVDSKDKERLRKQKQETSELAKSELRALNGSQMHMKDLLRIWRRNLEVQKQEEALELKRLHKGLLKKQIDNRNEALAAEKIFRARAQDENRKARLMRAQRRKEERAIAIAQKESHQFDVDRVNEKKRSIDEEAYKDRRAVLENTVITLAQADVRRKKYRNFKQLSSRALRTLSQLNDEGMSTRDIIRRARAIRNAQVAVTRSDVSKKAGLAQESILDHVIMQAQTEPDLSEVVVEKPIAPIKVPELEVVEEESDVIPVRDKSMRGKFMPNGWGLHSSISSKMEEKALNLDIDLAFEIAELSMFSIGDEKSTLLRDANVEPSTYLSPREVADQLPSLPVHPAENPSSVFAGSTPRVAMENSVEEEDSTVAALDGGRSASPERQTILELRATMTPEPSRQEHDPTLFYGPFNNAQEFNPGSGWENDREPSASGIVRAAEKGKEADKS